MHTIYVRRTYTVPPEQPVYYRMPVYRVGWSVEMFTIPKDYLALMSRHPNHSQGFRWSIWQGTPMPINPHRVKGVNWLSEPFFGLAGIGSRLKTVDTGQNYTFYLTFDQVPSAELYGISPEDWARLQQAVAQVASLTGKTPGDINREFRVGWNATLVPAEAEDE